MTLEVVHRHELAPESGVEFVAMVSGAFARGLILYLVLVLVLIVTVKKIFITLLVYVDSSSGN